MAERIQSANNRIYVQVMTALGVIPNTGGTADLAGTDAVKVRRGFSLNNRPNTIQPQNKTGGRSQTLGLPGRRDAQWSIPQDFEPSGTPGTAPDSLPLLQGLFGLSAAPTPVTGTGTVTAAVSAGASGEIRLTVGTHGKTGKVPVIISGVVGTTEANGIWLAEVVDSTKIDLIGSVFTNAYVSDGAVSYAHIPFNFTDDVIPLAIWDFVSPSTAQQRVGVGCLVNDFTFALGEDLFSATFGGTGGWVLSKTRFAEASTVEKAGLTAFPAEPTPVNVGGPILGFDGRLIIQRQQYSSVQQVRFTGQAGNQLIQDEWNLRLASGAEGDIRNISVEINLKETDDAQVLDLEDKSIDGSANEIIAYCGNTPGSIVMFVARNVQFESPQRDDSQISMGLSTRGRAYGSTVTAKDELSIYLL